MEKDREYLVENHGAGWFFYDETWDIVGPYSSEEEAWAKFEEYVDWLNEEEWARQE